MLVQRRDAVQLNSQTHGSAAVTSWHTGWLLVAEACEPQALLTLKQVPNTKFVCVWLPR